MSYNGSGTFLINTAGQPVVSGTVISSTAFNALTADLATGLSTAITKDGQTTITANIPMANYKFTGLGVGSAAGDSANLSQVQSTAVKLLASVSGADTITAVGSPNVAAYVAGQMFYFVAAGANTGAVTINIDSLGAKNITRDGTTALAAGDIQSGEVCVIVYDGTQFQLVNGASQSASIVTENLTVNKATVLNESGGDNDTRIEGDTDANLLFVDASTDRVGVGTNAPETKFDVVKSTAAGETSALIWNSNGNSGDIASLYFSGVSATPLTRAAAIKATIGADNNHSLSFFTNAAFSAPAERMRLDASGNLGVGTTSPKLNTNSGTFLTVSNTTSDQAGWLELQGAPASDGSGSGQVSFNNSNRSGTDKRIAQISALRGAAADSGSIAFTTWNAGTGSERARITAGGYFKASYDGTYVNSTASWHEFTADNTDWAFRILNENNSTPYGLTIQYSSAAPNDTGKEFFYCYDSSVLRASIRSNGGLANYSANNVNLASDERLKKDIAPLDSTWSKVKGIEVVNFRYKDCNEGDPALYGVIAQQVQPIVPELVVVTREAKEAQDAVLDDEGNVVTPAVEASPEYYGIREQPMYWLAIKALQEAMTRIEALEAEVAALKGAN